MARNDQVVHDWISMTLDRAGHADADPVDPEALAAALIPVGPVEAAGLACAIRAELLRAALDGPDGPRTVDDLLSALQRVVHGGGLGQQLLFVLRDVARREPRLALAELARRGSPTA